MLIVLMFRLLNPNPDPIVAADTFVDDAPMRYHGIEALLAKFEAEWDEGAQNL